MKESYKNLSLPRKALSILIELIILFVGLYLLNLLTFLSINWPSFFSSGSFLSTLVLILGLPLLLIIKIYLSSLFGYNYAINSKTGKTFLRILIGLLILDIIIHAFSDITKVRFYSELSSYSIEERRELLGDVAFADYTIKLFSGEIISWQDIFVYLIWQVSGLIAFAKGAFAFYKEEDI